MSDQQCLMSEMSVGDGCRVIAVADSAPPHIVRRLADLGLVPGVEVAVIRRAPMRDPVLYRFLGTDMCLRRAQSRCLVVEKLAESAQSAITEAAGAKAS